MKIITVAFCMLLVYECFSQEYKWLRDPVYKVDKLCILTNDSPNVAFNKIIKLLALNDYPIVKNDQELKIISAGPKVFTKMRLNSTLNIYIDQDTLTRIFISGTYSGVTTNINYGGGFGSSYNGPTKISYRNPSVWKMDIWYDMVNLSKQYSNASLLYGLPK